MANFIDGDDKGGLTDDSNGRLPNYDVEFPPFCATPHAKEDTCDGFTLVTRKHKHNKGYDNNTQCSAGSRHGKSTQMQ